MRVPLWVRCVCVGRNCAWCPWQPGSYRSCEASQRSCCEPGGRGCAPGAESLHPDTDISTETTREKESHTQTTFCSFALCLVCTKKLLFSAKSNKCRFIWHKIQRDPEESSQGKLIHPFFFSFKPIFLSSTTAH